MASRSVPHTLARATAATVSIKREPVYGLDPSGSRPSLPLQRSKLTELRAAVTSYQPTEAATSGRADQGQLSAWTSIAQERWEGKLIVEGEIPLWLSGTYLRNGPGIWHVDNHHFGHLFDGFGTLVRLHFDNGSLTAGHRQIESEAYKAAKKNNRLCYREYSETPKANNLLSYLRSLLGFFSGRFLTDNANNGVVLLGDGRVLCLTETVSGSVLIDPDTLDTVGKFEFADRVWGMVQSPHPMVTEKEFLTVLPDLVRNGYNLVSMKAGTNERKVIGRVDCRGGPSPGWMHSFPVTVNYLVVPEMLLRYSMPNLLQGVPTPLKWYPESGSFMHVMCRSSGKIVATVEVPPFMTCHFINAYEEVDEEGRVTSIIADCCEHNADPTTILERLKLHSLRSFAGQDILPDARVGRFRIPLNGETIGELDSALDPEEHGRGMDMCNVNPAYLGRPYRYAYACGAQRPCNFPNTLTKMDLVEKTARNWHEEGSVPSEPYFVARPGATEEDDGVVISIVSCKSGEGYALILDGSSFEEIVRANLPYGLPYGFHGCWVPKK
ncbi:hypothetical protein KSP39_PZI011520 [Platanthera zijinensis]|uniref:Carotenoid cleavage dioxygenase 8 n=1 Tax=Platanthera zijinensis TaxID=2320716 RepID=A0AAP0BH79_9ASPA